MARLRKGRLRWAIAGGLVTALVVAAVVAWPYVQRYTGSAPPPQFYDKVQLEPALARDYPRTATASTSWCGWESMALPRVIWPSSGPCHGSYDTGPASSA